MKLTFALLALICVSASAQAGWTVKVLHPAGATSSQAFCTDGTYAAGIVDDRAAYWDLATGQVHYLGAPGIDSKVNACRNGLFGGYEVIGGQWRARLWKLDGSFYDMHPPGAPGSAINAMNSTRFAGVVSQYWFDGALTWTAGQAAIWPTIGQSWNSLHPGTFNVDRASTIYGMDETEQAGRHTRDGAALWRGTAGSYVDLDPVDGPGGYSAALACANGVQVGWVGNRAALWRGTKESFVDLTPAGALHAEILGTDGSVHVGRFYNANTGGACFWLGSSNIPTTLPQASGMYGGIATGIQAGTRFSFVSGYTYDVALVKARATVWVYDPVPESSVAAALMAGLIPVCLKLRTRRPAN